jgi:hypothetical protein
MAASALNDRPAGGHGPPVAEPALLSVDAVLTSVAGTGAAFGLLHADRLARSVAGRRAA